MDEEFMHEFEAHRYLVNVPFIVHSGYRCPTYDERVREEQGQEGTGLHSKGWALDGHWQELRKGWTYSMYTWDGGIGLYLKGRQSDRFIHYDNGPWRVWTY